MIEGAITKQLTVREDERGYLIEVASDSWGLAPIVHVYEAMARQGVIKGFHAHLKQTDRFYLLCGVAKVGLVDLRGPIYELFADKDENGGPGTWLCHVGGETKPAQFTEIYPTNEAWMDALKLTKESPTFGMMEHVILSRKVAQLLFIPPGVAHGQMAIKGPSRILNLPTEVYNRKMPDEVRMPYNLLNFSWAITNR